MKRHLHVLLPASAGIVLLGALVMETTLRARVQNRPVPQGGHQHVLTIAGGGSGPISQVTSFFPVPVTPTIVDARQILTGESTLGPFKWTDNHKVHLDPTVAFFKPVRFTDGIALVEFDGGDALFLEWSGLEKTNLPPDRRGGMSAFHITGGRGRFLGATGVGSFETDLNLPADTLSVQFEATVIRFLPSPPGSGQ